MIASLAAFAAVALLTPLATRLLGRRVFAVIAIVPLAVFGMLLTWLPGVLAGEPVVEFVPWIPQLDIAFSFRLDALALLLALIVTGVGALVLLYCMHYFADDEPALGRFAALLLAFAGVMLGLVTSDDVFLLFMFWEATSVLSYLLIGHYTGKKESRGAALQALTVTTFGGLAMLVGLVVLVVAGGTSSLAELIAHPVTGAAAEWGIALVLVGAISKSALVPFHFWLPAAMAAPTPVSAYLHAAAMVKAGVYLVARLAPGYADLDGVASDRRRARRAHHARRRLARPAPVRPQAAPRLRHRQPARLPRARHRVRHPRRGARGRHPAARARPVQGGALPRGRHRRPRGRHARLAQALGTRTADARDRDDRDRGRRLDGRPAAAARLRRQGGRVHRIPRGGGGGRAVGVDRPRRRFRRLGAHRRVHGPLRLGRVLHQGGRRAHPAARGEPRHRRRARHPLGGEPRGRVRDRGDRAAARRLRRRTPRPRGVPPRALARPRARPVDLARGVRARRAARVGPPARGAPAGRRRPRGRLGARLPRHRLGRRPARGGRHHRDPAPRAARLPRDHRGGVRRGPRRGIRHEHHLARRHPALGLPGAAVPRVRHGRRGRRRGHRAPADDGGAARERDRLRPRAAVRHVGRTRPRPHAGAGRDDRARGLRARAAAAPQADRAAQPAGAQGRARDHRRAGRHRDGRHRPGRARRAHPADDRRGAAARSPSRRTARTS